MIGQARGSEVLHVSSVQESEGTVRVNAGVYRELAVREHKRFRFSPKEKCNITGKTELRLSPRSYGYSGEFGC